MINRHSTSNEYDDSMEETLTLMVPPTAQRDVKKVRKEKLGNIFFKNELLFLFLFLSLVIFRSHGALLWIAPVLFPLVAAGEGGSCEVSEDLPEAVGYGYLGVMVSVLIGVTYFGLKTVSKTDKKWEDYSAWKKFKIIIEGVGHRFGIYFAAVTHLLDQASDVAVILQFFALAKEDDKNKDFCFGVDARSLAYASLSIQIGYRLFSSIAIGVFMKSIKAAILQVLDFELFVAIFASFKMEKKLASHRETVKEAGMQRPDYRKDILINVGALIGKDAESGDLKKKEEEKTDSKDAESSACESLGEFEKTENGKIEKEDEKKEDTTSEDLEKQEMAQTK